MKQKKMAHRRKEVFSLKRDNKNLFQIYVRGARLKLENVAILAATIPGLLICGLSFDDPNAVKILAALGGICVWGMITYIKRVPEEQD